MKQKKQRLPSSIFKVATADIRRSYYSDKYFQRTKQILTTDNFDKDISFQFFLRDAGMVCGLDESLAILKKCTGYYSDKDAATKLYQGLTFARKQIAEYSDVNDFQGLEAALKMEVQTKMHLERLWVDMYHTLDVTALHDGDMVKRDEPIKVIKGNPRYYAHLETVMLGVISRASATASAVNEVVTAANGKSILFFPARFDHYRVQATDGYAAMLGGAYGVSTDSNADYWGSDALGTIPHLLIGCYGGDTALAAQKFDEHMPDHINRIVLVDWDNDCINTTLDVVFSMIKAKPVARLGDRVAAIKNQGEWFIGPGKGKLWGVRFDTSGSNIDKSIEHHSATTFGVCPDLVFKARRIFDELGLKELKIVVSGGFDAKKIELFEKMNAPVDVYGVGSSLLKKKIDVTADICELAGKPCSKVGRGKMDWSRLSVVQEINREEVQA